VRRLLIIALALVAALGIVSSASAKGRDGNHDQLPDRWERAHHLSLKVKQARRDQDRDGLNNRGEFRAHMNPRDHDSDDDGIKDGDENAGTIKSFENGVLTITLAEGGELAAKVDGDTEIECHTSGDLKASRSSDGQGDDDGPNHDAEEHGDDPGDHHGDDPGGHQGDEHGDEEDGDDRNEHGDDDNDRCGTDALKAGTRVHEAELKVTSDGKHWEELELIPAV
jgi:hypothetical protein